MKYFILTLGCQMNISDSQRIATKLEELGYKSAPEKEADLVVANACSVRQKAVDRIWGGIKKWQANGKQILLTGCILPADKKKFSNRDIVIFDINNLDDIDKILRRYSNNFEEISAELSINSHIRANNRMSSKQALREYFDIPMKFNSNGKIAYIPIMTGCDNFCSYCAVPYTRGREVSRPQDDILVEVNDALSAGFKEIWLLGQNVNSYGIIKNAKSKNQNDNVKFIKLLKLIDKLPSNFRFNFISSNPHDMGDDLIKCFAGLKKWTRELHLPMQSGDDKILRKMNRKYNSKQYLDLVSKLKLEIPASPAGGRNLKLSTDVIVGFPGETKSQFENTVKLCQKIKFTKAYIGQYSPRPGTAAAKLKDDVLAAEKKHRWERINCLINKEAR